METGLITKALSNRYTVRTDKDEYICKPRGLFRKEGFKPLCGDLVRFDITDYADKEGYIISIEERKNSLVRPPVANVDVAVIVFATEYPTLDELLIDLLILAFRTNDIEPILCLNKCDLSAKEDIDDVLRQYSGSGCKIVITDAKHKTGLDPLKSMLSGKVSVFAGQSGAGKSTLINAITGTADMEIGILSEKIGRGKNTTRHCELLSFEGGYIVDTPGFSKFDPGLLQPDLIKGMYNEFLPYIGQCRYNDCKHINDDHCAVLQAVEKGEIPIERHLRYEMIYNMSEEALRVRRGY